MRYNAKKSLRMNLTKIVNPIFVRRMKAIDRYATNTAQIQEKILRQLIQEAKNTEWGKAHQYDTIHTYEDFSRLVPVQTYENIKNFIDRMRHGEKNILWPGLVKWYAKSSGTTNDKSKFIPVSSKGLRNIHYTGGFDAVTLYLNQNPQSRFFSGKGLILGGSHAPNYNLENSYVGDLSAILMQNINPIINLIRVPKKETALLNDFEIKRDRIARETINQNVTNLSGVPSWMLSVLKRVLELKNVDSLEQVWPNLEIFFHGGVAFTPYREQYKQLIRSAKMHYMETYNASEGFFGLQNDMNDPSMLMMIDYGIFYEFIPMEDLGKEKPQAIPLWDVEIGKNYAMIISSSCGLWRYMIGDTIRFTHSDPYKFIITGRTKHFINAFGEELIIDNAEKGLAKACASTGAQVIEYTAAPVFMDANAKCRHQWLIEFAVKPKSINNFATILDKSLQEINSDYEAKRYKNVTLQPLEIIEARPHLFDDWLKEKGKLGGQHKIPRLNNNREYLEDILSLNH